VGLCSPLQARSPWPCCMLHCCVTNGTPFSFFALCCCTARAVLGCAAPCALQQCCSTAVPRSSLSGMRALVVLCVFKLSITVQKPALLLKWMEDGWLCHCMPWGVGALPFLSCAAGACYAGACVCVSFGARCCRHVGVCGFRRARVGLSACVGVPGHA
jgi:hypothetical protein